MKALARSAYGFLVRLHPKPFRAEFGHEMLWIFSEQTHSVGGGSARMQLYTHLLLDALRSLIVQRALRDQRPGSIVLDLRAAFNGSMNRVGEVGIVAISCLFNGLSIVLVLAALVNSR